MMNVVLNIMLPCGTSIVATRQCVTVVAYDGWASYSYSTFMQLLMDEKIKRNKHTHNL